jgi:hypothetical protein
MAGMAKAQISCSELRVDVGGQGGYFALRKFAIIPGYAWKHVRKEITDPLDRFHMSKKKLHGWEEFRNAIGLILLDNLFKMPQGSQMNRQNLDSGRRSNPRHGITALPLFFGILKYSRES